MKLVQISVHPPLHRFAPSLRLGVPSISVQPKISRIPSSAPQRIVVENFGYTEDSDRVRVDREGPDLRAFKRNLTAKMNADLVKEFSRFGLPVEVAF